MRQVRHRGKDAIVRRRVEHVDPRAASGPGRGHRCGRQRVRLRKRRQHDVAPRVQRGLRRGRARAFGTRDRMPRDESRQRSSERAPCRADDILLGAAGVGDDGLRAEMRRHRAHQRQELSDRCREQNQVRICELARPVVGQPVTALDDAEVLRLIEVHLAAPDTDDATDLPRGAKRQRERASDEPDADDHQLVDARRRGRHEPTLDVSPQVRGRARRGTGDSPQAVPP